MEGVEAAAQYTHPTQQENVVANDAAREQVQQHPQQNNAMNVDAEDNNEPTGNGLSLVSINSRLDVVGREVFNIQGIQPADLRFTVSRALMCLLYGAGQQVMFPKPSPAKWRDGVDNLAFIQRNFNPYAPGHPGAPGMFFVMNPLWTGEFTKRLFVRIATSKWLYLGLYRFIPARPLSVAEFKQLKAEARMDWVEHLYDFQWGRQFLVRIALRDDNGGNEPSMEQVAAICRSKAESKVYADKQRVTPQQVLRAFLTGKEKICVSCLKCIGYDVEWKKFLIDESRRLTAKKKNQPNTMPGPQHLPAANAHPQGTDEAVREQSDVPHRRRPGRPRRSSPSRQSNRRVPRSATVKRNLRAAGLDSDLSDISETKDESSSDFVEQEEEAEVEALLGL